LILSPYFFTLEIVDSRTILAKICVAKVTQRGPPQTQHVNDQNPACDPGSYHMYGNSVNSVLIVTGPSSPTTPVDRDEHRGTCPKPLETPCSSQPERRECQEDKQCPEDMKCCSTGCGRKKYCVKASEYDKWRPGNNSVASVRCEFISRV
jgi:hypothetical protein